MEKREGSWRVRHREIAYDWHRLESGYEWSRYPYPGYRKFSLGTGDASDIGNRLFADSNRVIN